MPPGAHLGRRADPSQSHEAGIPRGRAEPHLHLERLLVYAPDMHPDEGIWPSLKGVGLRNLCCVDLHHLRHELRTGGEPPSLQTTYAQRLLCRVRALNL